MMKLHGTALRDYHLGMMSNLIRLRRGLTKTTKAAV